ncbi:hypothetical protein L596_012946 [Steinernema carpocapsae]|uniref:UBC core domain-containing protein n=1 Tax=Steinernema carpocapsae TaxID=34508 RepID=A0A4U5NYR2_STECR|nr:hypothetical protein L596_012946 [Steinernema carpocapsae]
MIRHVLNECPAPIVNFFNFADVFRDSAVAIHRWTLCAPLSLPLWIAARSKDSFCHLPSSKRPFASSPFLLTIYTVLWQPSRTIGRTGSQLSPYAGRVIQLTVDFPPYYPVHPPEVKITSRIFHLNIVTNTEIGLLLLQRRDRRGIWSPTFFTTDIIRAVSSLL